MQHVYQIIFPQHVSISLRAPCAGDAAGTALELLIQHDDLIKPTWQHGAPRYRVWRDVIEIRDLTLKRTVYTRAPPAQPRRQCPVLKIL